MNTETAHAIIWSELTWPEIAAYLAAGRDACLLPVGATEQHGPHLGTGMDAVLTEKVCHEVSRITGTMMLPLLPYGCSLGHSRRWPGTLALKPGLVAELVEQIVDSAYGAGFRKFFLINGHVTNFAPLRCALEVIRSRFDDAMIAVCNVAQVSDRVQAEYEADARDWHANAAETALMMAQAPELVREEGRNQSDDPDRTTELVFAHPVNRTSRNGVTGFPSRATVEQGQRLFQWIVEDLSTLVRRGLQETPPLPHSYFAKVSS